jgi:catechol 2,3-dioxygenase-like lactoylglutathione lyase family enzyme
MLSNHHAIATLPAADLDRARRFYEGTLGFRPRTTDSAGTIYETADGKGFMVFPSTGRPSGNHTQITFEVDDVEREVRELKESGVRFEAVEMDGYDPETTIVTTDSFRGAWFRDPEGNLLALTEWTSGA